MIDFEEGPVKTVVQGSFGLLKRGRPTEKNPDGVTTEINFPWRVVQQGSVPFVVACGANGGMQYALKLTKAQMVRAIEEIERQEDQLRREHSERWGR